ncbi:MAG: sigma-70 family RNA polymerase sigma factor [Planctomycetota bacterium]
MDDSIHEIIDRVRAGDLDQYRLIVRTFEADVFRLAAPLLGNVNAAEDVAQLAFITAYRRLDSFDPAEPFRPWLMGIAVNLVRNELRRRSREGRRMELYSHYVDAMTSREPSPEGSDALSDALAKCRERLAQTAAAAIQWRYDEGLGLEALADRLQRSVTATRQLLYRTRLSLRDCIESQLASEGGD